MSGKTQVKRKKKTVSVRRVNKRVAREPHTLYRAALSPHPPDPIIAEELPRAVARIVNVLHPEKIILFGSHAYGTPTYDSDVDLLVVMETSARPVDRAVAVGMCLIPRLFPVDIIVKTPQEITHAFQAGDFFIEEIVSQGKILYERNN